MNPSAYLFLAVSCWLIAGLWLITIVYPPLVLRLREAVIAALINRAVLFPDSSDEDEFRLLQLRALIYDGTGMRQNVAARLSKLRELYLAMDHRGRRSTFTEQEVERYGRRCLEELATMVLRELRDVRPSLRVDAPIVFASEIMEFIANRDQEMSSQPTIHKPSEVEAHFRNKPLTMEQMGELLEALCYGLIYRKGPPAGLEVDDSALLANILRLEKRYRSFARVQLRVSPLPRDGFYGVLREALGQEAADRAVERSRREGSDIVDGDARKEWILEYLYLDELKQLIQSRWQSFSDALPSKRRVNEVFDAVSPIRNRLAHGRRLTSSERRGGQAACLELENWLERNI